MTRRRRRHRDPSDGLARAECEAEAATKDLLACVARLAVARERAAYYRERIRRASPQVLVSRVVPELVDRIALGARELAAQIGVELPDDGAGGAP